MATPVLEAVEAERKIVSDIRTVLRKLAGSRVLSVATKPANLARLTDEAFRQEFPADKPDNRLASAMARGIPARRKLAEDEGGRACLLCPGISDINLFRYCQRVIDLDAEIPDLLQDPLKTIQGLSCAPGVEREILSSSSFMSADTSPKRGVLK